MFFLQKIQYKTYKVGTDRLAQNESRKFPRKTISKYNKIKQESLQQITWKKELKKLFSFI